MANAEGATVERAPGVQEGLRALHANLSKVMFGKQDALTLALVALLGRGHLLIEDVPGVGKTVLARALAQSVGGEFRRLQCTPDLLPSDVTGVSVYNQRTQVFDFVPGPVFANILLADEINRAPPRAQSALLESMAEQQVTVDGHARRLPSPFMVIATQNPIEFHGTYPLPEAQLDRFFMRIALGYPDAASELRMVASQEHGHPLDTLQPALGLGDLAALQREVEAVRVSEDVMRYALALVQATRDRSDVTLGASPRATLALRRAAQALALLQGGQFATPQHVKEVARHVLPHRIIARAASSQGHPGELVVREVLESVRVPA
ncbi:MAG TPA: AAA family ATPase [Usitatibacter sp.]|nr:AAA family ATPase [Usitatibacter sp.]